MERTVRIRGTINDVVVVDGLPDDATDEEVCEAARLDWRYTEFEDLSAEIEE